MKRKNINMSQTLFRKSRHKMSDSTDLEESGRSMVEMLGVLTIAGLISLLGFSGYNTGMHKLRANNIAELISDTLVSSKTYRGSSSCISADNDDLPECVVEIKASVSKNIAKITFSSEEKCNRTEELTTLSFGNCGNQKVSDHVYYITPSVGSQNGVCDSRPSWTEC